MNKKGRMVVVFQIILAVSLAVIAAAYALEGVNAFKGGGNVTAVTSPVQNAPETPEWVKTQAVVAAAPETEALEEPAGTEAEVKDSAVLFDDFNRAELGVTGTGGSYNSPNSEGIAIYWIAMNEKTRAKVENDALTLTMDKDGWYGEGVAFKDPEYKYIILKIKGEKGGEEKLLSMNPDAKGLINFTDFKGPDGGPIPSITKDYQDIVIDIEKSGFHLPDGFEAIHFNNTGALTVYIDKIYLSRDGVPKN